ncbi:60S ribosomal protein L23A [Hypoxylon texense]
MDSSTSARGRGRKRHTLPITLPSNSSEVTEQTSTETPTSNMATRSFTFDTPSPSASRETRMRTRHVDGAIASPEDPTSKGGRSLRKRPRVDYTFDHLEETDNHGAKATPTTTRAIKRRKPDFPNDNDAAEEIDSRPKRRASEQPQSSSTRRRNYTRKSTVEPQTYVPEHQMEDVEVQDTIEVGGHHSSESGESNLRRASSGSSNNDSRAPINNTSLSTPLDMLRTSQRMEHLKTNQRSTLGDLQADHSHDLQQDVEDEVDEVDGVDEDDKAEAGDDGLANRVSLTHLDHLTPYIRGSYIYYPELYDDEPEADEDVNSEADSDATREADAEASPDVGPDADVTADQGLRFNIMSGDAMQQDTVAGDVATEDPTTIIGEQVDGPMGDTPAETAANSPSAVAEPTNTQNTMKNQFRFNQLRSASEFLELFGDIKSLPFEELYYRTEVTNRCLVAWQKEFNELRKFTDDYDNSVRYQKEEEAFERRVQAAVEKDPTANPERTKEFVVKGIRAEKEYTFDQAYVRQQDRIMANAYGFEYKPDDKFVGNQNPAKQREGLKEGFFNRSGRPRRGKKTPKATEAEESTQGKRPRKAPERFNGGDRDSSPVPSPRRGRRAAQAQENTDLDLSQQKPEPIEQEPQKKKGRGGRPRKNPLPEPAKEAISTPAADPEPNVEPEPQLEAEPKSQPKARSKTQARSQAKLGAKVTRKSEVESLPNGEAEPESKSSPKRGAEQMEEQKQPARKRRRQAPAASAPATTPAAEEDVHDNTANGADSRPIAKPSPRRRNSRKSENLSGSFNTTSSATSADQGEEARPLTASSTATVATVASTSNYQLREKRQRKFTNDITDEDFLEEPKPKRARAAPKKQTRIKNITATSEPAPAQQPEPEAVPAPKASKIIKLKVPASASTSRGHSVVPPANLAPTPTAGSNVTGTTNGYVGSNGAADHGAPADGAEANAPKDYSAMTKSEKMSASMKARWNSGSMDGAVQKRRATLAAKKQNAKAPGSTNPEGQTRARPSEDTESEDKDGVATE